jgi:gluconolactonase
MVLAGDYVFYLPPNAKEPIVVAEDMNRPNGIVGTKDGKMLYVADMQAGKTWLFKINPDGTLSDRKLFTKMGSDGMELDEQGNLYLTGRGVTVFNSAGEKIDFISLGPTQTSNVCFGGKGRDTLFVTGGASLFSIKMNVKGQ